MSPLSKEMFDKLNVSWLKAEREKFVWGSTLIVNPKYPEEDEEAFVVCLNKIFSELLVNVSKNEGLGMWDLIYSFGFDLKCKLCGHVYKHGITRERFEDKDPSKCGTRYRGFAKVSQEIFQLSDDERAELSKKFNTPIDDIPKELGFTEIEYRKCPKCFPRQEFPLGVPPDVAKLKSVTLVKFLLMCLQPAAVLSIEQIREILNYSRMTIERVIYRSEKEEGYYQGLREHLLMTKMGRAHMYCLKPESYMAFRQEYDIRQIRTLMDRFIRPSMYEAKFIPLEHRSQS